jgi:hypothetical protein
MNLGAVGRLGAIEAKQRAMSTRVWPGAMRTGAVDTFSPDLDPSELNTMVLVETLPGRWLVMGQFDLLCEAPAGNLDFHFKLVAIDVATGVEETSGDYDFPDYYINSSEATRFRYPVTLIGHFSNESDDNKNIGIQCREANGRVWSVASIRLKLIPR